MKENCVIYIVVPCYNEEEVLPETTRQLMPLLEEKPYPLCKRWFKGWDMADHFQTVSGT